MFNKGYVKDVVPPEPGENRLIVKEGVHEQMENVGTYQEMIIDYKMKTRVAT